MSCCSREPLATNARLFAAIQFNSVAQNEWTLARTTPSRLPVRSFVLSLARSIRASSSVKIPAYIARGGPSDEARVFGRALARSLASSAQNETCSQLASFARQPPE